MNYPIYKKEIIPFLRKIWEFHVNNMFTPRSSSHELFVACLASINSSLPVFAEYGAFTGHTSFYLTSIASRLGGESILIDNFGQFSLKGIGIPVDRFEKILKANIEVIASNRYTILNKDVFVDHNIDITPGLIYYDICQPERSADTIHKIVMEFDQSESPVIIIIDDVVQEHNSNTEFRTRWQSLWSEYTPSIMRPFFLTENRLYLSNYEIPSSFYKSICAMKQFNYIANTKVFLDLYDQTPIWRPIPKWQKDVKSFEFIDNEGFWQNLNQIYSDKSDPIKMHERKI